MSLKNLKTLQVLSVVLCGFAGLYVCLCLHMCVCECVCALLLDNRIISTGQIAALAECSGRRLSANISVLSPAE